MMSTRKKVIRGLLLFVAVFLVMPMIGNNRAKAAITATPVTTQVGGVKEYRGTLLSNSDRRYTHKVLSANVILSNPQRYEGWLGKEVVLRVQFKDNVNFTVLSLDLVHPSSTPTQPAQPVQNIVTIIGFLEQSPEARFTHFIQSGPTRYNLILANNPEVTALAGQQVVMQVQFAAEGKFTVLSIIRA